MYVGLQKHIKARLLVFQIVLFDILYAVWIQPHTTFIRNVALVLGASIGLFVIIKSRSIFFSCKASPILLIILLFIYSVFHMLFIGVDSVSQLRELKKIWLAAFLALLFGVGLGVNLQAENYPKKIMFLLYAGLLAPLFIFYIKLILTFISDANLLVVPCYFLLQEMHSICPSLFIHKTSYLLFTYPGFIFSVVLVYESAVAGKTKQIIYYSIPVVAIFYLYLYENSRNGILYGLLPVAILLLVIIKNSIYKNLVKKRVLVVILMLCISILAITNIFIKQNTQWSRFLSDAKLAVQVDSYDQWMNSGDGTLKNENGELVNRASNYERISWIIVGTSLIRENPLGYGLIEQSFGKLSKIKWPTSRLTQAHSGWIDLTLGLGIPGVLFILGALILTIKNRMHIISVPLSNIFTFILIGYAALFTTVELSQKVYFESFILFIGLIASMDLGSRSSKIE